jgi:hypothetical protein
MSAAGPVAAEVISVAGNGFELRETAHVAAAPDQVPGVQIERLKKFIEGTAAPGKAAHGG